MKKIVLLITTVFFLLQSINQAFSETNNSSKADHDESIKVHGVAEKEYLADKAEIIFLVEANDKSVEKVNEKLDLTSTNLISALEKLKLKEKSIEVLDLSIREIDKFDKRHSIQSLDHYHALKEYKFTIYKEKMRYDTFYEKVSESIKILSGNGVNQVLSLHFMLKDLEDKKTDLLKDAVKNAKRRAETMVKDLGLNLGSLLYITELEGNKHINKYNHEKIPVELDEISYPIPEELSENSINLRVEVEAAWKLVPVDPDHKYSGFIGN